MRGQLRFLMSRVVKTTCLFFSNLKRSVFSWSMTRSGSYSVSVRQLNISLYAVCRSSLIVCIPTGWWDQEFYYSGQMSYFILPAVFVYRSTTAEPKEPTEYLINFITQLLISVVC